MTDLSDGAYQLTKYLLENGHHRIAYLVGNRSVPVSNLRVEGYLSAYRSLGISHQSSWIVADEVTFQGGYSATEHVLSQFRPDAILTVNDFMAMGVLKCLKERHIKIYLLQDTTICCMHLYWRHRLLPFISRLNKYVSALYSLCSTYYLMPIPRLKKFFSSLNS